MICPDTCPHCHNGLQGEEIPTESRHWYGGQTHFSRRIGVEYSDIYDGILFWQCPFCGGRWHRFREGHHLRARAEPYVNEKE